MEIKKRNWILLQVIFNQKPMFIKKDKFYNLTLVEKLDQASNLDLRQHIIYQEKDTAYFHGSILQNKSFKLLWTSIYPVPLIYHEKKKKIK